MYFYVILYISINFSVNLPNVIFYILAFQLPASFSASIPNIILTNNFFFPYKNQFRKRLPLFKTFLYVYFLFLNHFFIKNLSHRNTSFFALHNLFFYAKVVKRISTTKKNLMFLIKNYDFHNNMSKFEVYNFFFSKKTNFCSKGFTVLYKMDQ